MRRITASSEPVSTGTPSMLMTTSPGWMPAAAALPPSMGVITTTEPSCSDTSSPTPEYSPLLEILMSS